jgi:hypothetical protein
MASFPDIGISKIPKHLCTVNVRTGTWTEYLKHVSWCHSLLLRLLETLSDISETHNSGLHPNRNVGLTFDLHHNVFGTRLFRTDVTHVMYFTATHEMSTAEMLKAKIFWFAIHLSRLADKRAKYHLGLLLHLAGTLPETEGACYINHDVTLLCHEPFQISQHGGLDSCVLDLWILMTDFFRE